MNAPHTRLRVLFAPAVAALLFAGVACGDDDDGGGPAGPEADEQYVRQLCIGFEEFTQSFLDAISNLDADSSDEEVQEALEEPIAALVRTMEEADPPGDVRDYHEDSLEQIRRMQEQIREGNLDALTEQEDGVVPEPPADVQERLTEAATRVEECQGINLFS